MNYEQAWRALLLAIAAENDYHDFKRGEIAILMIKALTDPQALILSIEDEKKKEDATA